MPSIIYVRKNPRTPFRRIPRGVAMNTLEPSRYVCKACREVALHYADGVVWCDKCGKAKSHEELMDRSLSPRWQAFVRRTAQVIGMTPREAKIAEAKKK